MAEFTDLESMDAMERRHDADVKALEVEIKSLLKSAKKSTRAQVEAQAIQMQFDMKARHSDELESLEEKFEALGIDTAAVETSAVDPEQQARIAKKNAEEEAERLAAAKKAKAQKKKVSIVLLGIQKSSLIFENCYPILVC